MVSKRKRDSPPAAAVPADDDPEPELDADDDEAEAAPSPADDDRPACKYGATCFRKNPDHFLEYSHPHLSTSTGGLKKKARTDAHASSSSSSSSAAAAAAPDSPASAAPSSPASAAARSSPKLTARQRKASADPTPAAAAPVSTGSWSGGGCDDDEDADMPAATAASSSSSAAAAAAARPSSPAVNAATSKLPACPYGLSCFRKNLLHFSEYSHPIHGATTKQDGGSPRSPVAGAVAPASSSSSSAAAASSSSGAFTLQRSYSQLTESERKLLVLNALQEKSKLEAALKNKDTELAAKAKEAEHLKAELGAGLMLLPGEAEALAGSTVKTFVLHASRTHETNASSMHFRLAESQFYRLLGAGSTAKITSVEYVVSPAVAARFAEAKKKIKGVNKPVLAFHGTADANIPLITASGFKMPGTGGHKHATDTGAETHTHARTQRTTHSSLLGVSSASLTIPSWCVVFTLQAGMARESTLASIRRTGEISGAEAQAQASHCPVRSRPPVHSPCALSLLLSLFRACRHCV